MWLNGSPHYLKLSNAAKYISPLLNALWFKEFVAKVEKFSPDIMEIIKLENNGIKMNDLLNELIGLTPLASGAIATMAVVETNVQTGETGP